MSQVRRWLSDGGEADVRQQLNHLTTSLWQCDTPLIHQLTIAPRNMWSGCHQPTVRIVMLILIGYPGTLVASDCKEQTRREPDVCYGQGHQRPPMPQIQTCVLLGCRLAIAGTTVMRLCLDIHNKRALFIVFLICECFKVLMTYSSWTFQIKNPFACFKYF